MKRIRNNTVFNIMKKRENKKLALCFKINDILVLSQCRFYIY